ncbi:MAG: helix-turn-helix transcriptional regulator, partial [Chloroflexi bacterium]|nr:helix-turn-helix transcriptional regulator [Chloroflexota bacterium]
MLSRMDERRLGLVVRALRRRRGWRQLDLGRASGVSQSTVSEIERGYLDSLSLRTIKAVTN